jgi:hypothetical protein
LRVTTVAPRQAERKGAVHRAAHALLHAARRLRKQAGAAAAAAASAAARTSATEAAAEAAAAEARARLAGAEAAAADAQVPRHAAPRVPVCGAAAAGPAGAPPCTQQHTFLLALHAPPRRDRRQRRPPPARRTACASGWPRQRRPRARRLRACGAATRRCAGLAKPPDALARLPCSRAACVCQLLAPAPSRPFQQASAASGARLSSKRSPACVHRGRQQWRLRQLTGYAWARRARGAPGQGRQAGRPSAHGAAALPTRARLRRMQELGALLSELAGARVAAARAEAALRRAERAAAGARAERGAPAAPALVQVGEIKAVPLAASPGLAACAQLVSAPGDVWHVSSHLQAPSHAGSRCSGTVPLSAC